MNDVSNKYEDKGGTVDTSSKRTCPLDRYDCRVGEISESSLREHYISEQHQRSITKYAKQIVESTDSDSTKADADTEEGNASIVEHYKKLSIITKNMQITNDEIARLDADILRCHHKTLSLRQEVDDMQVENSIEKTRIDAMSINQETLRHAITSFKEKVEGENEIIIQEPDGTMVWKINNVQEKMYDAQSERQTSIYSPPFFTSNSGYKVCVRLYLNGDGSARNTHISCFLVILRGPFDPLLKWPFSYRVSFCLFDQRTMIETNGATQPKHIIESFRPDTNSISFKRPPSAMNIASGIPKFVALTDFNQPMNENLYIINDTIYIKTFIDFIGLARSMLPFIFNINTGFPVQIRQKLISDEIKRREQQTPTEINTTT